MGDFNSRVGRLGDFVEPDDFLTNVKQHNVVTENIDCASYFETLGIPISRAAMDTVCNNFGYKMIDFCKNNNFLLQMVELVMILVLVHSRAKTVVP